MDNYIMYNGIKIELTPEQVKLMQESESKKSPFDRADEGYRYYYSDYNFEVLEDYDRGYKDDELRYKSGNYCTDENIMKQHALHMKLNNLLWRYSMTHGGDGIDWDDCIEIKVNIYYDTELDEFGTTKYSILKYFGAVPFISEETAKAAIEEIVKPFIAEHPDFDVTKM